MKTQTEQRIEAREMVLDESRELLEMAKSFCSKSRTSSFKGIVELSETIRGLTKQEQKVHDLVDALRRVSQPGELDCVTDAHYIRVGITVIETSREAVATYGEVI